MDIERGRGLPHLRDLLNSRQILGFLLEQLIFISQLTFQRHVHEVIPVETHVGPLDKIYLPVHDDLPYKENDRKPELKNHQRLPEEGRCAAEPQRTLEYPDGVQGRKEDG